MTEVSLNDLIAKTEFIFREAYAQFKNMGMLWSTGKDSTADVHLGMNSFPKGKLPFPVVHLDTGRKFKEIYEFRDRIADEWDLELIVAQSPKVNEISPKTHSKFDCCTALKTEMLKQAIRDYGFDAIVVSIRRDEHGIRAKERYMSPRDKEMRWKVFDTERWEKVYNEIYQEQLEKTKSEEEAKKITDRLMAGRKVGASQQDTELSGWNLFESDFGPECQHVRVHPILHWTEFDVWRYIKRENVPYNPLYRADYVEKTYGLKNKRFRSLGCLPCTQPIDSTASTIDDIVEELKTTKVAERSGRAQDKEAAYIMQRLRALGYM